MLPFANPRFRVTLLPFDQACAINNRGEIAGIIPIKPNSNDTLDTAGVQAAVYADGRLRRLARLRHYGDVTVSAINDRGQVVGSLSSTTSGAVLATDSVAAHWERDGSLHRLTRLPGSGNSSFAVSLNQRGQVVGTNTGRAAIAGITPHAFLAYRCKIMDLGPFDAEGINDRGQVIGTRYIFHPGIYTPSTVAILWQNGTRRDVVSKTGSGRNLMMAQSIAINNRGQIIGATDGGQPVLWSGGQLYPLRALPGGESSSARAINDHGQIVGSGGEHPLLWQNGKVYRLDKLVKSPQGFVLEEAVAINNRGQILVNGYFRERGSALRGSSGAVLLTPQP